MNANDGGLGVATVLETVRALQAGPPLINDVVLWFGDADETTAPQRPAAPGPSGGSATSASGSRSKRPASPARACSPSPARATRTSEPPLLSLGDNEGISLDNAAISTDNGRWLREALDAVPAPRRGAAAQRHRAGCVARSRDEHVGHRRRRCELQPDRQLVGLPHRPRPPRPGVASQPPSTAATSALALARHFGDSTSPTPRRPAGSSPSPCPSGRVVTYPTALAVPAGAPHAGRVGRVLIVQAPPTADGHRAVAGRRDHRRRRRRLGRDGRGRSHGLLAPDATSPATPTGSAGGSCCSSPSPWPSSPRLFPGAARLLKRRDAASRRSPPAR